MRLFVCLVLVCLTLPALAEGPGQSDMFVDKDYQHLTKGAESQEKSREEKCMEISSQMERLKGKPQQRFVFAKRYEAECER